MMIWTWIGALLIGLTLGLLGSGGSILTVPVLVYLVGEPEKVAIAESLGIVTLISLVGAIPFAMRKLVDWRNVLLFGVPGMAGAYFGAALSRFMSGQAQLVLFAGVMLLAAVMMFRRRVPADVPSKRQAAWKIVLEGLAVGVLTGLVGVGGGFLIVPALVLLGGLPMRLAVGTSLAIIAIKSISGFYKYIDVLAETGLGIDWQLVALFSAIGIAGTFVGRAVGNLISQESLKKGFAVFLVVMASAILWQNAGVMLARSQPAPSTLTTTQTTDTTMFNPLKKMFGGSTADLSPEEFRSKRTENDAVIDVRTPGEFAGGRVAGAENIDLHAPDFRDRIDALDRDRTYYLYCRSGARSGTAARMMTEMGFEKVHNVGGIESLAGAGVEIER